MKEDVLTAYDESRHVLRPIYVGGYSSTRIAYADK